MNYKNYIIELIESQKNNYESALNLCKVQFSEEPVHDFRVSIRRFLALIDFLNSVETCNYLLNARKLLKKQIKYLNPLRDTQVQIITTRDMMYSFPIMYKYYTFLVNEERKLIIDVMNDILELDNEELSGSILFYKIKLKKNFKFNEIFSSQLNQVISETYDEVLKASSEIDNNNLQTIHELRLTFKSFRYTMEIYNSFDKIEHNQFKKMKNIQNILGAIQDNRVIYERLNEYVDTIDLANKEFFLLPFNRILKKREKLMIELVENIEIIKNFDNIIVSRNIK